MWIEELFISVSSVILYRYELSLCITSVAIVLYWHTYVLGNYIQYKLSDIVKVKNIDIYDVILLLCNWII